MIVNIEKRSVNEDYLINAIKAEIACGNVINYLVMNATTFHVLVKAYELNNGCKIITKNYYSTLLGYPIAICDKLGFGEVDFV